MSIPLLNYVVLPKEATAAELKHVQRINKVAMSVCLAHIPLFVLVAWLCHTSMLQAVGIGGLLVLGPIVASHTLSNPRTISLIYGFTSMALGALLVHLGQGPMQIEMHFHFFAGLALLTVWGNPLIIWVATVTVALHHGLFWLLLPQSVFNYDASIWVVGVHAAFVVVEAIAAAFIARNFFDNVIGLEKIVQVKTVELMHRNNDMKTILDNTSQGFLTASMDGRIESEKSAILSTWLGNIDNRTIFDVFDAIDGAFSAQLKLGWNAVVEDFMPVEITLDQLPKQLPFKGKTLGFEYRPIKQNGAIVKMLLVISDLTAEVERVRSENAQKETMAIFERLNRDRNGFLEFMDEGSRILDSIVSGSLKDEAEVWRAVHTLKGNCGLFGISSVAELCHKIEDQMAEEKTGITVQSRDALKSKWNELSTRVRAFTGDESNVVVEERELLDTLVKIKNGLSKSEIINMISSWRYEPMTLRFKRFSEQASTVAERLGKHPLKIEIKESNLRLPQQKWSSFWAAFTHAIRNAIDHGIAPPEERSASTTPYLRFTAEVRQDHIFVAIEDNGRGIDWERVKQKSQAKGLPAQTRSDLVQALLSDGFSTKDQANTISGRGVGMGSLFHECSRLGGTMEIISETGKGTTLAFKFPLSALLEQDEHAKAA